MKKPKVSIIIVAKEYSKNLEESINYCRRLDYPNYEIIVVLGKKPGKKIEGITVMDSKDALPADARDLGAKKAKGSILAFLDDDAYPANNWLREAVKIFEDPNVGAVGGPAVTPGDDKFLEKASGAVYASPMGGGGMRYRYVPMKERVVDDYPSCNLLVRKDLFKKIGGFKTKYWPGEDTKLCLEIVRKEKKIVYSPNVMVCHHRRALFKPHLKQVWSYGEHRGFFVKKFPQTSRRWTFFLPSLFTLFILLGPLGLLIHPLLGYAYMGVAGLYLLAVLVSSLNPLYLGMLPHVFAGTVLTHITYGVAFLVGLCKKELEK